MDQKKHQQKRPYQKNQNKRKDFDMDRAVRGMAVRLSQNDFTLKKVVTKMDGLVYTFDKYLRMKGDAEKLNELIQEDFKQRQNKTQETESVKSDGSDSKSAEQK